MGRHRRGESSKEEEEIHLKRKVIQIQSSIDSVGKYFVLAICNDGTIWKLSGLYEGSPTWEPFPVPPQDTKTMRKEDSVETG